MSTNEEIYPLGRDNKESSRLNVQHELFKDIIGGLVDDSIPLGSVSAVADVATGTGVWLQDLRRSLRSKGSDQGITYTGFDISDDQFPMDPDGISFAVHDILKPFPEEHQNRYDVVHVRLLVAALGDSQLRDAILNLITLLKPGGYLQWVDLDYSDLRAGLNNENRRITQLGEPWVDFVKQNGLSVCAPGTICSSLKEAGMLDVRWNPFDLMARPDINLRVRKWQETFFVNVMPMLLLRTGQAASAELAAARAEELLGEFRECLDRGQLLDVKVGSVVARRPAPV